MAALAETLAGSARRSASAAAVAAPFARAAPAGDEAGDGAGVPDAGCTGAVRGRGRRRALASGPLPRGRGAAPLAGRGRGGAAALLLAALGLPRAALPPCAVPPAAAGPPRRAAALLPLVAPAAALAEGAEPATERLQLPSWVPQVGDQLKVKPGLEFTNKEGEEVYGPGDYGYVRRILSDGAGEKQKKRLEIVWPRTQKLSSISVDKWNRLYDGLVGAEALRVRRPASGGKPLYSFEVPPGFQKRYELQPEVARYGRKDGATIYCIPLGLKDGPGLDTVREVRAEMQRRISTGLASFGTLGAFRTAILQNRFGDAEDLLETTEPLTPDDGTTPSAFKSQFHRWWRAVRSPSLSALIVVSLPEASLEAEGESMQSVIRSFQLESAA